MLHRILILALSLILLPATALAQDIEGRWDLRVDGTTIFRFDISEGDGGEWHGIWYRPESFATDGNAFGRIRGGVEEIESMTGIEFLEMVELSFDDPRPGAIPDIFRFQLLDADSVRMTYVGTDLAPYALVRAGADDAMGDWDQQRVYRRPLPGNSEDDDVRVRPIAPASQRLRAPVAEAEIEAEVDRGEPPMPPIDEAEEAPEEGVADEDAAEEVEDTPRIGADFLNDL